jgi:CYTH domain-containing protein
VWQRTPGKGRYAQVERERRFLLAALPGEVSEPRTIVDRYVAGTRLRLRQVAEGGESIYKLAQKVRPVAGDPTTVKITNVYLDQAEYRVLAALPAQEITKTRYTLVKAGRTFSVDAFHGPLEGLILAEVDIDAGEFPAFAIRDVSADDRYTGGRLAWATPEEIASLIPLGGTATPPEAPVGSMAGLDPAVAIAENYRRFARLEAAGRSPAYERLTLEVAGDRQLLGFLESLPAGKRQPNLFFAAARYLLGVPPDASSLRGLVSRRPQELTAVMAARRTQTNEAARCAIMMPALAALPGPLALIEVGAAAGLTLLVDRYSYDYAGHIVAGADPQAAVLRCQPTGAIPLPACVPEVEWRAGLDLNPLDTDDPGDVEWLRCLLWPGEADRAERLSAAIETARRQRPVVHRGDLVDDLASLAEQAPAGATLVIYHSAVLAYVDRAKRAAFAELVSRLAAVWLSYEAAASFPTYPNQPTPAAASCSSATGTNCSPRATPMAPTSTGSPEPTRKSRLSGPCRTAGDLGRESAHSENKCLGTQARRDQSSRRGCDPLSTHAPSLMSQPITGMWR